MEKKTTQNIFSRFLILINISSPDQNNMGAPGPINRPTVFHRPWNRREVQVDLLKFPSGQTLGVPAATWKSRVGRSEGIEAFGQW